MIRDVLTPRAISLRLTVEEWDELFSGSLRAQGQCNSGEAVDRIEPKDNIVVLIVQKVR